MLALLSIDLHDRSVVSEIGDSVWKDLEERGIVLGREGGRLGLGHLGAHVKTRSLLRSLVCNTFTNPFLRADLIAIFHGM